MNLASTATTDGMTEANTGYDGLTETAEVQTWRPQA